MMEQSFDTLIVGGGPGGRTVARALKKRRPQLHVAVIKEHEVNPNRCVIPYIYDDTVPIDKGMIPNSLVTEVGAELLVDSVERIAPQEHRVELKSGRVLTYRHLVLATGSQPVIPPLSGADLDGVHVVRECSDIECLMQSRATAQHAVVIGLGLIGVEVAASLKRAGLEVTGIDQLPHALGQPLDRDFAQRVDAELERNGVSLLLNAQVKALMEDSQGRVRAVQIGDRELPAELVVLAVGVRPRTELAEAAGATCERGGIVVDAAQRTSLPDVFAVGDCAQTKCAVSGQSKQAMLGTIAVIQAKTVARQILGETAYYSGTLGNWACQVFDLPLGAVGVRASEAEAAGIEAITGESQTSSQYPQMPHVHEVNARLVFEADTLRVLGAQISGTFAAVGYLDLVTLAIQQKLTARDLQQLQYATHPELAPRPSDNLIVMAAEHAISKSR